MTLETQQLSQTDASQQEPTPGQALGLLIRLGSKHSADRWTAQTELRRAAPLPLEALLPAFIRLARTRRQSPFLLMAGLFAGGVLLVLLELIFDREFGPAVHLPVLLAGLVSMGLVARRWIKLRSAAAGAFTYFNDVRLVGPLLPLLSNPDREVRRIACELLVQLLPRLRPLHAEMLGEEGRNRLRDLLIEPDAILLPAVLKAAMQVGEASWLPLLTPLAENDASAEHDPQTPELARTAIQGIAARRKRDRLQTNLLPILPS